MQHMELPGTKETFSQHKQVVNAADMDLVSSDDSNFGSEVKTVADEDDNVDDLIDNVPGKPIPQTPGGDIVVESQYRDVPMHHKSHILSGQEVYWPRLTEDETTSIASPSV